MHRSKQTSMRCVHSCYGFLFPSAVAAAVMVIYSIQVNKHEHSYSQWSWNQLRLRLANTGKSSIFTHIHKIHRNCISISPSILLVYFWLLLIRFVVTRAITTTKVTCFIYFPYLPAPYLCIPWNFDFTFAWDRLHSIRLDSIFHILFLSVVVLIYRRAMQMKKNERPCLMAVNHNRLNMNQ